MTPLPLPDPTVPWITVFLYLALSYLVASIPTSYWLTKKLKGIDIREHGSGNAGATNVFRVVGKKAGIFVLCVDFLKGFLLVLLARLVVFPELPYIHLAVAVVAIVGHSRSIFLNFTGGKSAITGLGAMVGLAPWVGLILAGIAGLVIKLTRTVSIGSMVTALCAPIAMYLLHAPLAYILFGFAACGYVIYRHKENIQRLMQGTENRF